MNTTHQNQMKHESFFEQLRTDEYARLDKSHQTYLDYTGSGLYPSFLPKAHSTSMQTVYGNPHTDSPASIRASRVLQQARERVLTFFRARPDEYDVIFTPNATGAIKIVGEAFPFDARSTLMLSMDNHNSVLGIREYARCAGARVKTIPLDASLRLHKTSLKHAHTTAHNLLAYPAQSNFSGVKHPLSLITRAQQASFDVLLDAAAFVPTNPLDLTKHHPDFVPISFYKMFGYPTGIGALVVKHAALKKLRKRWFAGGTVTYSSALTERHTLAGGSAGWEDGTVDFLAMPAVLAGLDFLSGIGPPSIQRHVHGLTERLLAGLQALRHGDGARAVIVHGPRDMHRRGATVAFDVLDRRGRRVDAAKVERWLGGCGVSIRAGCFCNPGCAEAAYGVDRRCLKKCAVEGADAAAVGRCLGVRLGSLRASLGVASVRRDVERFTACLKRLVETLE